MHPGFVFATLVGLFMATCAVIDYRTHRIPNWLTVSGALLGLLYNALAPHGAGPLWSLAGLLVGFSLLMLPWLLGGGGMGDVKMLAALGAWLGPIGILVAFGLGSILAVIGMMMILTIGMCTAGFGATRRQFVAAGNISGTATNAPRKARRVLPFAVPMACSTWLFIGWMLLRAAT